MKARRRAATIVLAGLALALPARAAPQHVGPDASEHLALASANAMIGAAAAGVGALLRGEDTQRAFLLGAAGGSLGYLGKYAVTVGFTGAPIVGRQVAAVGNSIVANAASGDGALAEIWLPVSPLRVRLPTGASDWGVQLDLADLATVLYGVLTPELHLDGGLWLRYGTPVFVAVDHRIRLAATGRYLGGVATSGVILLSGEVEGERRHTVLAHEMVHILQSDFAKVAISYPVEQWAVGKLFPEWGSDAPVQGGFVASGLDLLLGGLRDDGVLREAIEREASVLVQGSPAFVPVGR